ncbi:MAG: xanthine permease XanP [Desulfobulbaceae bacterium S3730MH12]|nr:MAG: xanthine permease XanP [Desulfobulbaceae bacterium S3730MH12]
MSSEVKESSSDAAKRKYDLIYGLDDKPAPAQAIYGALQHLLAMFVGIITPAIIISGVLGLSVEYSSFLISMALFASGVGTFIQVSRFGPLGSGLLSIQGVSFTFISTIIVIGLSVKKGGGSIETAMATIFGCTFLGSFFTMAASRALPYLQKIITPVVSGVVVLLIGLTLIQVGMVDFCGGFATKGTPDFGSLENVGLGALVMTIIIFLNRSNRPLLRMGSVVIGLMVGYIVAAFMGKIDFSQLAGITLFSLPVPFKFGFFQFDFSMMFTVGIIYLLIVMEAIGDLTATSMLSGQPVEGEIYVKRISGGILADGFNSAVAAVFSAFPLATFSQNNGVIQMTGVASRHVGKYIAGIMILLSIFPVLGGIISIIPKPVLGGATLILFAMVASAGIRIITSRPLGRQEMLILAISLGSGLGAHFVPEVFSNMPKIVQDIGHSSIAVGGMSAILATLVLSFGGVGEEEGEAGEKEKSVEVRESVESGE